MVKKKTKSKPKPANIPSIADTINNEVIAAALRSTPPPVFMKVCRLCESKDGPFLNIFDAHKITAKKIDELMPFGVTENDDLPHKICFRCSAKLEELYEFIQKCIKTQESLHQALGKTGPFVTKTKTRAAWEQKLNKSNISNDDICDALIKKAMEGIKDIPTTEDTPAKRVTRNSEPVKREVKEPKPIDSDEDKPIAVIQQKEEHKEKVRPKKGSKSVTNKDPTKKETNKRETDKKENPKIEERVASITNFSLDYEDDKNDGNIIEIPGNEPEPQNENISEEKPFDIYDYISTIKVNRVGILFQCKLCNRNFLNTDTVESHGCARNRNSKVDIPKSPPEPEPPKIPNTVKYIKMDDEMKKTLSERAQKIENEKNSNDMNKPGVVPVEAVLPPKPRAGPASKTKRLKPVTESEPDNVQPIPENAATGPSLQFANMPNLNGRYKLVPGPNNSFTLVEESASVPPLSNPNLTKKRKSEEKHKEPRTKELKTVLNNDEVIDVDEPSPPKSLPYPVGMFQTVGGTTRLCPSPPKETPPTFTTPAMKKQSYTVVQTGNPSKLLISTKAKAVEPEEVPKKKQKKKSDSKLASTSAEPFQVTLEDVEQPKDTGFFTFINVDPLLQPSYVLPTHNIIQESQISTSTAVKKQNTENKVSQKDNKYSCNMCGETFSREKKLLAHIQSHFTKMDEEDQKRLEQQPPKRKTRRS